LNYLHSRGEALHIQKPLPVKATYIDWADVNWNAPQDNLRTICTAGYNVIIMAFYLSGSGPTDMAQAWAGVGNATQASTMVQLHREGCIALVSFGGSTDSPYSGDPRALGNKVSQWALANNLDGVDFDLENLDPGFVTNGMTAEELVSWMANLAAAARQNLGPHRIITHAPQAPYFSAIGNSSNSNPWPGPSGGYTAVWKRGNVDWFNMQFYNQGATCYTTFETLFKSSNAGNACPSFPYTSVSEIAAYGVPLEAIVVGKPLDSGDAGSGYVPPDSLHVFVTQAASLQWNAGVMNWQWHTADGEQWIHTVYP
jgi:chitinase